MRRGRCLQHCTPWAWTQVRFADAACLHGSRRCGPGLHWGHTGISSCAKIPNCRPSFHFASSATLIKSCVHAFLCRVDVGSLVQIRLLAALSLLRQIPPPFKLSLLFSPAAYQYKLHNTRAPRRMFSGRSEQRASVPRVPGAQAPASCRWCCATTPTSAA